jgi:hypothetical protein
VNRTMRMPETLDSFRSQSAYSFSDQSDQTSLVIATLHTAAVASAASVPSWTHHGVQRPLHRDLIVAASHRASATCWRHVRSTCHVSAYTFAAVRSRPPSLMIPG